LDLHVRNIELTQFKNFDRLQSDFHPRMNIVTGLNGSGKTNLLDSIYYLVFCKSAFTSSDQDTMQHGQSFMRICGNFAKSDQSLQVVAKVATGRSKEFLLNDQKYKRLADHIGLLPLVQICPDDIQLVKGHSDERRKLLDSHISQFDAEYLQHLLQYNKALKQRNAYLKTWSFGQPFDQSLLKSYDSVLIQSGTVIYDKRKQFIKDILGDFNSVYQSLSEKRETVSLHYKTYLDEYSMRDLLDKNLNADKTMHRTTQGVHRDDLVFAIHDKALKRTGSQGQQKTFIISLKLAMFYFLKRKKSLTPILLLDDIFDKLDGSRMGHLLAMVGGEEFGQVFITDTHPTRLSDRLDQMELDYKTFEISKGKLAKEVL